MEADIQVIIPKITDAYKEIEEYEEKIPLCILDNFPYKIEHTIIYSKNLFNKIFINGPNKLNNYLKDLNILNKIPFNKRGEILNDIKDLINNICLNFEDCIKWALNFFCKQYRNKIL